MELVPKASALYVHAPKPDYDCDDCVFYILPRQCLIHGANDYIAPEASCGYFIQGTPSSIGLVPLGLLTKQETGYVSDVGGASCKRCTAFNPDNWGCQRVDKDSVGDDPGMIHPDACCVLWS